MPNHVQLKKLYDVKEAAKLLSVGRSMLYGLLKTGDLHSVKVGSRRLIPATSIEAFVDMLAGEA